MMLFRMLRYLAQPAVRRDMAYRGMKVKLDTSFHVTHIPCRFQMICIYDMNSILVKTLVLSIAVSVSIL